MMHEFVQTLAHWVQEWGYWGVIVLMAMESSIFPVPSELVIPPAAYMAAQNPQHMSLLGVILAGTVGSWLGSAITYWVSRAVGRPVVLRWGKFFFIKPEKLERAEIFLARYEAGGIFFARLLPVVRHLISIPAGIVRMPFGKFSLFTVVGSAIWCAVLTWYGKGVSDRHPDLMKNLDKDPEALVRAVKHESIWLVAGIAVLCVLYFLVLRLTAKKEPTAVA